MFMQSRLTCPLCGNTGVWVHTYKTQPTFGGCEACGYLPNLGYTGRGMIEHRRPKTVPDWDWYDPSVPNP